MGFIFFAMLAGIGVLLAAGHAGNKGDKDLQNTLFILGAVILVGIPLGMAFK